MAIVVLGFVVSSVFWYYRMPLWTYGVLFATALIDVVLYLTVGNLLHATAARPSTAASPASKTTSRSTWKRTRSTGSSRSGSKQGIASPAPNLQSEV